jgi:hypothetical protein
MASFLLESLPLTLMTAGYPTSHNYLVHLPPHLNVVHLPPHLNVVHLSPRLLVEPPRLDTDLPCLAV